MTRIIEITAPTDQQGVTQLTVLRWLKRQGQRVTKGEALAELSTDKLTIEIEAPDDGILIDVIKEEKHYAVPGEAIARLELTAEAAGRAAEAVGESVEALAASASEAGPSESITLEPGVERMLTKHCIKPERILATGDGGAITIEDVLLFISERDEQTSRTLGLAPASAGEMPTRYPREMAAPEPEQDREQDGVDTLSDAGPSRRMAHSPAQRAVARHVTQSIRSAPHAYIAAEVDVSGVLSHRARNQASFEEKLVGLTLTPYYLAAAAKALAVVPQAGARWREEGIEIFEEINIGLAVPREGGGLSVPVLHQVPKYNLFALAGKVQHLTHEGRTGRLRAEDVQGGTFTLLDLGEAAVSSSLRPILHQPQTALLAAGGVKRRPVCPRGAGTDQVVIRPVVTLTLTFDHRALDPFMGERFLAEVVSVLEGWT